MFARGGQVHVLPTIVLPVGVHLQAPETIEEYNGWHTQAPEETTEFVGQVQVLEVLVAQVAQAQAPETGKALVVAHLQTPEIKLEPVGHVQTLLELVAFVPHLQTPETGKEFGVWHTQTPFVRIDPAGQTQTFEVFVAFVPQTQTPDTGKALVVEHLQIPFTKVEPVGQVQTLLELVALTPQTHTLFTTTAFGVVHEQLLEIGRDPVAQQQSPDWRLEPVMHGQVPEYDAGSLIIWEFAKPTKVMLEVETTPEPEVSWTKPQFKVGPEVTRKQVMFQIVHAPLFSQMNPQVLAPERDPETVRFLKVEAPRTKETKPQLVAAEVVMEKLEFWIIKLFTQLEIPQNLEIVVLQMNVKVLLFTVRSSVRLLAIPQKLEIGLLDSNWKVEPLISIEYSGTVATRKAKSLLLEFESFMFISVSTMVTFQNTKKNKLKGWELRSNSESILTEKVLQLISLNITFSVLVQRSRICQFSNTKGVESTIEVLSQNGSWNTQLQQKSNSEIENTWSIWLLISQRIIREVDQISFPKTLIHQYLLSINQLNETCTSYIFTCLQSYIQLVIIQLWEVELLFLVYYVSNYILKYFATSNADDKFQQIISSWRLFMNYSLTQEGQKYDFDRIRPQSTIQSRYLIFQKGKIEITTCNKRTAMTKINAVEDVQGRSTNSLNKLRQF
ncbi:Hypothetical_protein [Hexamita inflata]|uniref:Hypothetical_protein n=1 Tax=Hexamita inflata TaxID=28002 RepID=A0AA86NJG3_9EUKA|nr:Hypothetical protein HINF_LOCUS7716 [Hexamita inflata]